MKRYFSLFALVFLCAILVVGCSKNEKTDVSSLGDSKYSFVNTAWMREGEHDVETIRFGDDGSFSYSCACGNPVNDADLCEGYTYDSDTKTITLECIETTDDMVTVIKIAKCDEKELKLDFNGEIRIFTNE